MNENLGYEPVTFIPPWNLASKETKDALIKEGFRIYSGVRDEFEKTKLLTIGFTSATATFYPHTLVTLEKIKKECLESLERRNYCVIMIHPQDYLEEGWGEIDNPAIDLKKYKQFTSVVNFLLEQNLTFTTFRELHRLSLENKF